MSYPPNALRAYTPRRLRDGLARIPDLFQRRVSSGRYRPEIDGLRFIAIAVVVIGHFAERAPRFFSSLRTPTAEPFVGSAPTTWFWRLPFFRGQRLHSHEPGILFKAFASQPAIFTPLFQPQDCPDRAALHYSLMRNVAFYCIKRLCSGPCQQFRHDPQIAGQ